MKEKKDCKNLKEITHKEKRQDSAAKHFSEDCKDRIEYNLPGKSTYHKGEIYENFDRRSSAEKIQASSTRPPIDKKE